MPTFWTLAVDLDGVPPPPLDLWQEARPGTLCCDAPKGPFCTPKVLRCSRTVNEKIGMRKQAERRRREPMRTSNV